MVVFKGGCRERKTGVKKEFAPTSFKSLKMEAIHDVTGRGCGVGVWLWSGNLPALVLALSSALGGHSRTLTLSWKPNFLS